MTVVGARTGLGSPGSALTPDIMTPTAELSSYQNKQAKVRERTENEEIIGSCLKTAQHFIFVIIAIFITAYKKIFDSVSKILFK